MSIYCGLLSASIIYYYFLTIYLCNELLREIVEICDSPPIGAQIRISLIYKNRE
jgi:hypothetical protein